MTKNLVIVESPAKAKTIEGFLGKDYTVKSCFGHIRDLPKSSIGVDIDKDFTPVYEIPSDKKAVVNDLKKLSKQAETVWLATDEDREGEAISWHLTECLALDAEKYKRIVFHEITKKAILSAIEKPRLIDSNLVDAQQARRVLDRLVGFELSPLLWKKVKPALSAGRVQSVAVRLIVEREKEIQAFKSGFSYRVTALFLAGQKGQEVVVRAELPKRFATKEEALAFLESCKGAIFTVVSTETRPVKKSPAPPFTTSTLQQEASRKLGFSVSRTMLVAQKLYEAGKITYMRTDSVNLSSSAMGMAKAEILRTYGEKYVKLRQFTTKAKGAQEAHEAIRPTDISVEAVSGNKDEQRLYELIRKRMIASQMSDALLEKTTINISISKNSAFFVATGEVLVFDGFLKVYLESSDDEEEEAASILPPLKADQILPMKEIAATQRFLKSPPRYTEASLVKKMEEQGIGRPSTYAPTISTIQKREYVVKENRDGEKRSYVVLTLSGNHIEEQVKTEMTGVEKNKLFPTDIGVVVNNFLMEYFHEILDYSFTANVEKEFDNIAHGKMLWHKVIKNFYETFHNRIEHTLKTSEKHSGERLLGVDPTSGRNVYVKIGRFGPMVQIGDPNEEEKPRFAKLKKEQSLDTIGLAEALELFRLPRKVGDFEDKEIVAAIGRFGAYLRHDGKFYSIPKTEDPLTVNLQKAIEYINEKRLKEQERIIMEFEAAPDIKILKGRWGAYIAASGKNYKIPKGTDPSTLDLEACMKIIGKETPAKKTATAKKVSARKKSGKG